MNSALEKALSQAIGRPVDTACKLIESLLGKPFEVAGSALADQVQMWQWRNRVRIAERAHQMIEESGIARRVLPPDFLLPLIRDCGDTSDETLQEAWARLLAAAVADDAAQHIGFVHILKQLAPADAKVLDALVKLGPLKVKERADKLAEATELPKDCVKLSLSNLQHLAFFTPTGKRFLSFAVHFLRTCLVDRDKLERYLALEKEMGRGVVRD